MGSGKKEILLAFILLPLWAYGAVSVFKGELLFVKAYPELKAMDAGSKGELAVGAVYAISKSLSGIPENSAVFLFDPLTGGEELYFRGRLNYYLYPRKVVKADPDNFDIGSMKKDDYVVMCIPAGYPESNFESALGSLIGLEKIYGREDVKGSYAAYKVLRGV